MRIVWEVVIEFAYLTTETGNGCSNNCKMQNIQFNSEVVQLRVLFLSYYFPNPRIERTFLGQIL